MDPSRQILWEEADITYCLQMIIAKCTGFFLPKTKVISMLKVLEVQVNGGEIIKVYNQSIGHKIKVENLQVSNSTHFVKRAAS